MQVVSFTPWPELLLSLAALAPAHQSAVPASTVTAHGATFNALPMETLPPNWRSAAPKARPMTQHQSVRRVVAFRRDVKLLAYDVQRIRTGWARWHRRHPTRSAWAYAVLKHESLAAEGCEATFETVYSVVRGHTWNRERGA